MKRMLAPLVSIFLIALAAPQVFAQTEKDVCAVYFTYVGCPHCAITDFVVLVELTEKYPNLVMIEYEFVLDPENSYVLYDYNEGYNCGVGVPLLVFGKGNDVSGDIPILRNVEGMIESGSNSCPLPEGSSAFKDLDLTGLPGKPKIWTKNRILIKSGEGGDNILLKELLTTENLSAALEGVEFEITEPEEVLLSGIKFPQFDVQRSVKFEHAIKIGNWKFQWNGEDIPSNGNGNGGDDGNGGDNTDNGGGNNTGTPVFIYYLATIMLIIIIILLVYFTRTG